jgi:hypothetical protein
LICSGCQTVYAPSEKELGKVDSLAGLCEKCGTSPHFMPFAMAYIEGAGTALVTILVLLMVFMSGTLRAAAVLAGSVIFACLAMWTYARQSAIVRCANERDKRAATWPHRLLGLVFGVATSIATHVIIQTTSF